MRRNIAVVIIFTIIFALTGMIGQPVKASQLINRNDNSKIFTGSSHTMVLMKDGTVWSWGRNNWGQLGDGTTNDKSTPVKLEGLNNIETVSLGAGHTVGLKKDGTVWTWGNNEYGQLGDGTFDIEKPSGAITNLADALALVDKKVLGKTEPVEVKGINNVRSISAGWTHTVALKEDGTVWTWGNNKYGQLADGTNNNSNIPIKISKLNNIVAISARNHNNIALREDGTVWTWGPNTYGQLGDGTNNDSNIPVKVKDLNDIISVSAGTSYSIALGKDGTVYVWGYNNVGQLGNGTNNNTNIPIQLEGLDKMISIVAGSSHNVALREDGTVWTWGYNKYGQLGDGKTEDSTIPVQVIGLDGIVFISSGYHYTAAIKDDGTIWSWGVNEYGQLGNGKNTNTNRPVQTSIKVEETIINYNRVETDHLYDTEDTGLSIVLPYENITKITSKETAIQTVTDTAKKLTKEQKTSPTGVDLITLFAEEALSQGVSTTIEGNNIEINSKIITPLETTATHTKTEINKVLELQGITTAREMPTAIKLKTESTKDLKITLDKSILTTKTDKITIESPNISIKIDTEEIKEDLKNDPLIITITEDEELVLEENYQLASLDGIQIAVATKKTYTVNFNRAVKENITVSLPKLEGDATYQAVITDDGTVVGGKYNPAKNTIDVKIKESGKYTVKENKKDFTDIKNKSKEMQEAIKVLASKGIIAGNTATTFNPDGSISRAEITALIVKTLSKVDKTAAVKFKDITSKDWYYNVAGSSHKYGIINGYDDNTFRGKQQIKKDQIIAVAARTLKTEMKYKAPKDIKTYLNAYKDNEKIASWAKADISLATRENLVLKRVDGNFLGNDYMTRGDAAIIIKRLFDKIW